MIKYKSLIVVGTSHIAKQSLEEVEGIIRNVKPEIVALELDKNRFFGLQNAELRKKPGLADIKAIGFKGYLFAKIGEYAERKMGASVGVSPGSEMLKAAEISKEVGARVALIDQDIQVTLKNFSKELTWKERWRGFVDVLKMIFRGKKKLPFDLKKVPDAEWVTKVITKMKNRYPNVYKTLVGDRNKYMAKRLFILMKKHSVVAVVGAGHEKELIEEIKNIERAN